MSLLYSCLPASASGGAAAKSRAAKSRHPESGAKKSRHPEPGAKKSRHPEPGAMKSRHPSVDIHCHVFTPMAAALAKDHFRPEYDPYSLFNSAASKDVDAKQAQAIGPLLTSVAERLKVMDRDGIDIQAISTAPVQYYYWAEPELGLATARVINQNIASICEGHPERFVGLATVPMQSPELAVRELTRAVKELGLKGVEICPHVESEELSADRFRPFWAKAEELGVLVFLHPHGFPDGRRLASHFFSNIIGNPLDTTLAVHHLIFGGVLESYPGLKIVLAHGGGYLPSYAGRIDHAHGARPDARTRIQKKPSSYLKKFYFDTIVFTHHQLEYLAGLYGSDHILLGTDYPFDMALPNPVGFVEGAPHLSEKDKALILGANAARLLGIKLPAKTKAKAKARR